MVYGYINIIDNKGKKVHEWCPIQCSLDNMVIENRIPQPTIFMRAKVYRELGDFREELKYVMDYEYWLRVIQSYKVVLIQEYLANFRIHEMSKTNKYFQMFYDEALGVISELFNASEYYKSKKSLKRQALAELYIKKSNEYLKDKFVFSFLRSRIIALTHYPLLIFQPRYYPPLCRRVFDAIRKMKRITVVIFTSR